LSENEEIKKSISTGEAADESVQPCIPPKPAATGNQHIEIISHNLYVKEGDELKGSGVVLNLKNNAGKDIGKAVFSVILYDATGNVIDTVEESLKDFDKDGIRSFSIEYPQPDADIRSYAVSIVKTVLTPDTEAVGNNKVAILNHRVIDKTSTGKNSLELKIQNTCDKTLATTVLEVNFFDGEGNMLDTVRHKELDMKPDSSRLVFVSPANNDADMFRIYKVTVRKAVTTDYEKVQLHSHDMKPIDGAVEISGVVKNISDVKTDAAVVTLFKDVKDEKIATRVIYIRNIEPGAAKQFRFKYIAPPDESVNSYIMSVGNIAEDPTTPAA
jgi:hypothetical protein